MIRNIIIGAASGNSSNSIFGIMPGVTFSSGPNYFYARAITEGGIAVDGLGNFHVVGTLGSKIYVSKISPAGNILWQRSFIGYQNSRGTSCALDASGNLYVTGVGTPSPDLIFYKFSSNGTQLFELKATTVYWGGAASVAVPAGHNTVLLGPTIGSETYGGNDAPIYRINADGTNQTTLGGTGGLPSEEARRLKISSQDPTILYHLFQNEAQAGGSQVRRYQISQTPSGETMLATLLQGNLRSYNSDFNIRGADGDSLSTYVCGITQSGKAIVAKYSALIPYSSYFSGLSSPLWAKIFDDATSFNNILIYDSTLYLCGEAAGKGLIVTMDFSGNVLLYRHLGAPTQSNIVDIKIHDEKIPGIGNANGTGFIFKTPLTMPPGVNGMYSITSPTYTATSSPGWMSGTLEGASLVIGASLVNAGTSYDPGAVTGADPTPIIFNI